MTSHPNSKLVTTVIGAGPAGLLFCVASRLLFERLGGDVARWPMLLLDKRAQYSRTHRLRLAPAPYRALQADLDDPRFDALIARLDAHDWKPVVNVLEDALSGLVEALHVERRTATIGPEGDAMTLADLGATLRAEGVLDPARGDVWTVVGADSVHSSTRALVQGDVRPRRAAHQHVARLKVEGDALPERVGELARYRLAKALTSALDYRYNANGYAEVDLFVSPAEFADVERLGARPAAPVLLDDDALARLRAPLLRRIVDHLRAGGLGAPCRVLLQSTFTLEHAAMPQVVFAPDGLGARVFLVGDAAVSLPFFRGMACLAKCAHALAWAHCDMALDLLDAHAPAPPDDALPAPPDEALRQAQRARPARAFGGLVPLVGRVEASGWTRYRGRAAYVVAHAIVWRGVHVLSHDPDRGWRAHHYRPYLTRAAAARAVARLRDPAQRYGAEVEAIQRDELRVVQARARLIQGVKTFIRLSALVPWQVVPAAQRSSAHDVIPTPQALALNAALALTALLAAWSGAAAELLGPLPRVALYALAALAQALGGAVYAATRAYAAPTRAARALWRAQSALVLLGGVGVALATGTSPGRAATALIAGALLLAAFALGLAVADRRGARWAAQADPDDAP